jgi:tetratricopeptide (TPR) repeat protein
MTHDEALSLLSARIDGPLTGDQQLSLDAWIGESPDNHILAEAFQTQHVDLRTTFEPRREAAKETAAAVARQLKNAPMPAGERPASRWRRLFFSPLFAGIAAAVMIAIGLVVYHRDRGPGVVDHPVAAATDPDSWESVGLSARKKPEPPKTIALVVNDTVKTDPGEKRRVVLPDGSLLYLNQNTIVELPEARHIKLTKGEVFLEAVPAKSEAERFVVDTPKRSVTALGTKFAVSTGESGTGVLVTQGKIEVAGLAQKLTSGQELLAGGEKIASAPRASAALEWTKDLMIAAESPLVPAGMHSGGSLVAVDPYGQEAKLSLTKFHVDVHIEDGFARTTIDQTYFNSENWRMEGTFYFPLPPDASLSRLAMYVDGDLMEGGMAEREHARDVYERIRYQNRDPALLEWVDGSVFKMRVFPLEARQEKRIILSYTQRLPVLYGHTTYRFPAGHTLALVDKWSFHADVKGGAAMSGSSPSHPTMKLEQKGQDLVMTDEARNVKIDRDVVLELQDHSAAEAEAQRGNARWSAGELDGQKYMMVRYRPDLPSAPRRERRDWVFLFESSGARDPLVARAQVEVIRALLTHAEHDDTFAILSVGTRVRAYSATPQAATDENVAKAIDWLDHRHLIGALNLDQALSDVAPLLQAGSNPHLVHVGGGIASIGEQRADVLVKRIPVGTKYVGIGVGKRFSPAFMKVAAERTGGLFTQVNPDEPIAWRGFEIASTLNAPRLLNVSIECPGTAHFLTFSNVLAHGEEFAAVANVTRDAPKSVTIRGTLDGQAFEKTLPVSNVAEHAGYLPRTWAKLEIDRLLADDSARNQKEITDLSKAMYVMTPFTSLLVLENEQMYKDFKVDRGRKDHWALYPCPPKIPVVYIPDPNQPAGSRPDLKGQKPHENQVLQTVMVRNQARYLTVPGPNAGRTAVETAGQRFGSAFALPLESDAKGLGIDSDSDGIEIEGFALDFAYPANSDRYGFGEPKLGKRRMGRPEVEFREVTVMNERGTRRMRVPYTTTKSVVDDGKRMYFRSRESEAFGSTNGTVRVLAATPASPDPMVPSVEGIDALLRENEGLGRIRVSSGRRMDDFESTGFDRISDRLTEDLAFDAPVLLQLGDSRKSPNDLQRFKRTVLDRRWKEGGMPADGERRLHEELKQITEERAAIHADLAPHDPGSDITYEAKPRALAPDGKLLGYMAQASSAPQYYGRPSFSGDQRVFIDLVAYAPGMSSSPADVRMVLEAEAAPRFGNRLGSIDPAARKLIEAARSTEWKSLKLPGGLSFVHDGSGRYAYERTLALGLKEQVVCDGTHLWHLYPELGIGAKRVVSRFHRETLNDLIPDFLPPTEDLAHGTDVKAIDAKTVALSPLMPPPDQEQPIGWIETHLVFDADRLAERQWVLIEKDKPNTVLVREVYDANGTKWFGPKTKDTPLGEAKRDESPSKAPNLKPDMSKLVVLPLPLRTREQVYPELYMEPSWDLFQDRNACFQYFDDDSAMKLLACEFAFNNGYNVARVWDTCFAPKGDQRTGFFTLMAAANYSPRTYSQLNEKFEKDPSDPLVRYLWQMHDDSIHEWQARLGIPPTQNDTFLGRLTSFRRIVARWQGGFINHGLWGQRDSERERTIEFAKHNAGNVLGWCTLAMVQDCCPSPEGWKNVAEGWKVLAEKSGLRYQAQYEEARALGNANLAEQAQAKFQALFADALKAGVLPPLDASFRSVLESGQGDIWAKLMRDTAAKCARPAIVTLAWQCYQLGDTAMADTLLELALDKSTAEEKPYTSIAAIHFLNATGRYDRSDMIVRDLLKDASLAKSAGLWRLASQISDNRRDPVRSIDCLEKALDIEYARIPDTFDVQPIRNDYGRLLSHYEWLADASASLTVPPPKDLIVRVVKAADRWRQLDPEAQDVPNRAAATLRKVGGEGASELAWDYATTPLALKPNESSPWVSLAWSVRQEGNWRLADKCYEMAFDAEPSNAQLLWDRAEHLRQQGLIAESRRLLKQLADGEWQPRFNGLKAQARQAVGG